MLIAVSVAGYFLFFVKLQKEMGVICQKWDYLIIRHKTHPKEKHHFCFPWNESLLYSLYSSKQILESWDELKTWFIAAAAITTFLSLRLVESWVKQSFKWTFNYSGWCISDSFLLSQAGLKVAERLPMHGLLSVNLKLHELHFKHSHWWSDQTAQCIMTSVIPPDRRWLDQIFISILLVHHPASGSQRYVSRDLQREDPTCQVQ